MARLDIRMFPCLSDNYGVLIKELDSGAAAAIDAPDGTAVIEAAEAAGWDLTHILVTHSHADHVQGIEAVKARFGCRVVGPKGEADSIPGIDDTVAHGDRYAFGGLTAEIIETPGHTTAPATWYFPEADVVFTGDTLFALGCGRVFTGSMEDMWESLQKLARLPKETLVYCGHEYTVANAKFALTIEPHNHHLQARADEANRKRSEGEPTLPTTIGGELLANPFMRADRPEVADAVGMTGADPAKVFAEIRRRKDAF
ncbi:hydroxyacylglutathione hydrolase [Lutibaculum baratangense]|uniref:Hydroxyacylglutathione hydrolase n=1 Tax=Lutibaculum baratangense AMV1 TaxID=631454 RepID=V4RD21_9HYPH|nr:hydroxyacylglutathione hydrolase [Lutibaculum baratangense]ESR24046.1 Hydroxyacylglutathione hydrolase [Lutibaculum baratangense AMV1]